MKKNTGAFIFIGFYLLVVLSCLVYSSGARSAEKDYQVPWCQAHKGQTEVVLIDKTRVDCLTDTYAIEFDYGKNWAEALGQALHYSTMTGKAPGVVLIIDVKGERFVERFKLTTEAWRLPVRVWVVNK